MRVLIVSPSLQVAGAEQIVVALARHAAAQHHEVVVAAPTGPLEDELRPFGIACHSMVVSQRSIVGAARAATSLARLMRTFRPTVIHAHNPKMTAVAAAARKLSPGCDAALIATFHGGDLRDDRAAARLLRAADHVVCVEHALQTRMLANGCRRGRTAVIVNGVAARFAADDAVLTAVDAELGRTGPLVAIVGSLIELKSVDRFVRAAAIVHRTVPAAQFVVVGDGPLRAHLEALAVSSGCAEAVRFLGVRRDATAIVQRATAVVSTSRTEGLSLVALEALGAGTPLIAPDVGGMRRLLQSGGGVLLEDTEPSTVAAAIVGVLELSDDERAAMGQRGRELVESHHSRREMLHAYMAMYGELSRAAR